MGQLRTKSWDVYAHRPRLDCCLYPAFFISLVGPWRPFIPMTGILDLPFLCNRRSAWPFYTCALPRINIDSSPSSVVYFSLPWSLRHLWVNIASLIKKNRLFVCPSVVIRWSSEKNFASLLFSCDCYVNTTRLFVHLYKSPRLSLSPFNHCAGRQYVVIFYSEAGSSYHLLGRLLPLCSSR